MLGSRPWLLSITTFWSTETPGSHESQGRPSIPSDLVPERSKVDPTGVERVRNQGQDGDMDDELEEFEDQNQRKNDDRQDDQRNRGVLSRTKRHCLGR